MARHRNVRKLDLDDELSEDVYGHSYDDDNIYGASPSTEAEYMFRRDKGHTLSSFIENDHAEKIDEEDYYDDYDYGDYSYGYNQGSKGNKSQGNVGNKNQGNQGNKNQGNKGSKNQGSKGNKKAKKQQNDSSQSDNGCQDQIQFCIEQINDVLGDSCDNKTIRDASANHHGNAENALNQILDGGFSNQQKSMAFNTDLGYYPNTSGHVITTPKVTSNGKLSTPKEQNKPSKKSPNSTGTNTPTPGSRAESKENLAAEPVATVSSSKKNTKKKEVIDVKAELKKRQDGKDLINLVVIGHVDAGKSTLMGHLLFNLGNVSKKVMHKNEMESKKSGKGSFAFAWVLDETEEERARGVTIDVAMTIFETKTKIVTLMDAPGHRDFIPNMIQGTAQADVAILVVDSRPGEFEAGFEAGGQTREHAVLARSLGVGQLVVAVNKMDSINWSKERYDAIVIKLKTFLAKQAGFRESDVYYLPCSGLSGENLTEKAKEPSLTSWYKKQCLVEYIDLFRSPERPVDKPFRCCISDVYKGQGAVSVAGKVETGFIQNGDKIIVMPAGETGLVKGLQSREEPVAFAAAGDHITGAINGIDMSHLSVGSIMCEAENPIKTTMHIVTRIVVFDNQIPITKGFMVVYHSQNMSEPATVNKLVSILHKASGEVIQKRPRCLTKHMNAVIEVKFSRPVCVELYRDNKILGRFMLRYSGKTLAAGVITEIK